MGRESFEGNRGFGQEERKRFLLSGKKEKKFLLILFLNFRPTKYLISMERNLEFGQILANFSLLNLGEDFERNERVRKKKNSRSRMKEHCKIRDLLQMQ